jgi:hypothetical protein
MRKMDQWSEEFVKIFWSKINITREDSCWPWKLGVLRDDKPYGRICVGGKLKLAHRVAYELYNGMVVPDNLQVCHSCDNPICCNPKHLWLGTNADNMHDKSMKGRINTAGGPEGLFTYDEWIEVKRLFYEEHLSKCEIARRYNTYDTSIRRILEAGEGYRYKGRVL